MEGLKKCETFKTANNVKTEGERFIKLETLVFKTLEPQGTEIFFKENRKCLAILVNKVG